MQLLYPTILQEDDDYMIKILLTTKKNGTELPAREMEDETRVVLIDMEEGTTTQLITLCCCRILELISHP